VIQQVNALVAAERLRQNEKWGEQNHGPHLWITILMEEVGEFAKAVLERQMAHAFEEAIQVAAVAIAMSESFERNELLGRPL
jgi:NTP pyrophosphatase (non-canonical NTP hydrolase)